MDFNARAVITIELFKTLNTLGFPKINSETKRAPKSMIAF